MPRFRGQYGKDQKLLASGEQKTAPKLRVYECPLLFNLENAARVAKRSFRSEYASLCLRLGCGMCTGISPKRLDDYIA